MTKVAEAVEETLLQLAQKVMVTGAGTSGDDVYVDVAVRVKAQPS